MMVLRTRSTSPGKTGFLQRNSSMPGEPNEADCSGMLSQISRIAMLPVCQPEATRPPKWVCLPPSSDR